MKDRMMTVVDYTMVFVVFGLWVVWMFGKFVVEYQEK
jgi:hypothetical protein